MNNRQSKTDRTIDQILEYIASRGLCVNDKLPSEDEWVQLLGVSRLCVREALLGLKFLGVLQSGTRRGTTLCNVDFSILSRILGFQVAVSGMSFKQLVEARLSIELGAYDLICGKISDEDYQELHKLADSSYEGGADLAELAARDCRFHQGLVRCCGNQILISFSQMLEIFFQKFVTLPENLHPICNGEGQVVVARTHVFILDALRYNNLELARGLLRTHLGGYEYL